MRNPNLEIRNNGENPSAANVRTDRTQQIAHFLIRICFGLRISCFGFLLLASSALAQVLRPIDPSRLADANSKVVDMPTVNLGTVPQPTAVPQPVSPLSRQLRERGKTVETKAVETHTLPAYSIIPVSVLPHQNFTPKRGIVPANTIPSEQVKTSQAEIEKRVIRPLTPTGIEELKKQLSEPH
jgi:hypothetical protein